MFSGEAPAMTPTHRQNADVSYQNANLFLWFACHVMRPLTSHVFRSKMPGLF